MTFLDKLPPRQPWHGLTRDYYESNELFERETDRIFRSCWVFVAPSCELQTPGEFATITIGNVPVLLIRDDSGKIRALHNVCSHRATVLCEGSSGRVGKVIVCPYHQWTYTRSGAVQSCRDMGDVDREQLRLPEFHVLEVAGLVFVSLSKTPVDPELVTRHFCAAEPHGFENAKVAKAIDYRVQANWKIVWENNRECYHCDHGHPQYVRANFDSDEGERTTADAVEHQRRITERATDFWSAEGLSLKYTAGGLARFPDPEDTNPFPVSATRTVMVEGYESESMDGRRVGPFMGRIRSHESGVLRLRSVPSFWAHASCDHAVLTRVVPLNRNETAIRVMWLVDRDARDGIDYSLEKLMPFWQLTSEQDWDLCERVAKGIASPHYRPGPLSRTREYNLEAFFQWYFKRIAVDE